MNEKSLSDLLKSEAYFQKALELAEHNRYARTLVLSKFSQSYCR
jgi:hypothetical protein